MLIINNRQNENRWNWNAKNNGRKKQRSGVSYSASARAKWLCCTFKFGFVQLICEACLIFMSNLELALSIIWKERELSESKHVVVECRIIRIKACCGGVYMFKNMQLVILFDMFLNPSFKIMTSFANVARTTASTSKFIN